MSKPVKITGLRLVKNERRPKPEEQSSDLIWNKQQQAWVKPLPPAQIDRPRPQKGPIPTVVHVDKMGDWWYVRFRYHSKFIFHLKKEIPGGPDHSTARRLWNNNLKAWLVHDDWTRHLFFLLHKFFKDIVMTRRAGQSHRVQPPMSFSEHERALAEANPDPIELDLFGGERAIDANGEPGEEDPKAIPKDVKDKITFV